MTIDIWYIHLVPLEFMTDGDIDLGIGIITLDMPEEEKDRLWSEYIASSEDLQKEENSG